MNIVMVENGVEISLILEAELSFGPAVPLLGLYLKNLKTMNQTDICTTMVIAALFNAGRIWNQPS